MKKSAAADIVIFGGGIAGLWLLNRLRQSGLTALLCETNSLGGGQTYHSQGIIHGGLKYALQGVLNNETQAMSDMPTRWKRCLSGEGEIDLSQVPILSPKQYLWGPRKFASKLTGFLASAALTSKVEGLSKAHYPAIFQHPAFKGEVFALDEMVLDIPALVSELVKNNQDAILNIHSFSAADLILDAEGNLVSVTTAIGDEPIVLNAQQFIFTAGAGNQVIIEKLKQKDIAMQFRPLHMVLAKMPMHTPLYAHCLGFGSRPRITITSHFTKKGEMIWYLGGSLAEDGVSRDKETQIQTAKQELTKLFPWLDLSGVEFATVRVDRAEPLQPNGFKPETAYVKTIKNMMIAWPTKLALAPKLADEVLQQLQILNLSSQFKRQNHSWPMPPLATPIWENAFCKDQI